MQSYEEWWNNLNKTEKRFIAVLWVTMEIVDDMIKNPTPELKKLMGYD